MSSEELVRKIAHLAKLSLTAEEIQAMGPQLEEILKYVESLKEVDVTGIEPLYSPVEFALPMRADEVRAPLLDINGVPRMLEPAPATQDQGFQVPPIL